MCRLSRPELQNLVVHFTVAGADDRRRLSAAGSGEGLKKPPDRLAGLIRHRNRGGRGRGRRSRRRDEEEEEGRRTPRRGVNFYVVSVLGRSCTVFPASGNVVVTGLRSEWDVKPLLVEFARVAGLRPRSVLGETGFTPAGRGRINSTYSGRVEACADGAGAPVSVCRLLARFSRDNDDDKEVSVSFRSQFFPSVRVRWTDRGTANVFNNGKYVLVGVKTDSDAEWIHRRLSAIIGTYWTTINGATRCAWNADSCSISYADTSDPKAEEHVCGGEERRRPA